MSTQTELLKAAITTAFPGISETQAAAALAIVADDANVKMQFDLTPADNPAWKYLDTFLAGHVTAALKNRPDLSTRVPSADEVAAHLTAQRVAALGNDGLARRPEIMLQEYRRAQGMTDAERIATGAKAAPPKSTNPAAPDVADGAFHLMQPGDVRLDAAITKRWGLQPHELSPSKYREYIAALAKESEARTLHPNDEYRLGRLSTEDPARLRPEERIELHRIQLKAAGAA